MSTKDSAQKQILREMSQSSARSPLFWWMCEHHDEILEAAAGRRLSWRHLLARFKEAGLTDLAGRQPSPSNARKTWLRARREVARLRDLRAAKPAVPRAPRAPADWRPTPLAVITAEPIAGPASEQRAVAAPIETAVSPVEGEDDPFAHLSPQGREMMRRIKSRMHEADRHLRLPNS